MSTDLEHLLADVRLSARTLPTPVNGEPLADYAMRCVTYGALLAVKPMATLTYVSLARITNDAEDRLAPTLTEGIGDEPPSSDPPEAPHEPVGGS